MRLRKVNDVSIGVSARALTEPLQLTITEASPGAPAGAGSEKAKPARA